MDRSELEERLTFIYQSSKEIEERSNFVDQQMSEIRNLVDELESVESMENKEMLSPLGIGTFLKTEITDKKLFVNVGQGVLVRKTIPETKEILEVQIKKLLTTKEELARQLAAGTEELQNLISNLNTNKHQ